MWASCSSSGVFVACGASATRCAGVRLSSWFVSPYVRSLVGGSDAFSDDDLPGSALPESALPDNTLPDNALPVDALPDKALSDTSAPMYS